MWRKTRSVNHNSRCRGVDPNRNWDFHWGGKGTSSNPCDEIYRGTKPFSEVETRTIGSYIWTLKDRIKLYASLHAYSQLWLTPWGYTPDLPTNYRSLLQKGRVAIKALSKVYGTRYEVGSSTNVLYEAAGGSVR